MIRKTLLLLLFFLYALFIKVNASSAQTQQILGVVSYDTHEELTYLFGTTNRSLVYLSGEKVEESVFVGLFTTTQKESIEKKGLKFNTIDEDANIDDYIMLYNPQPDQGKKLEYLGTPHQFTKRFVLLELKEGVEYSHEGVAGEFFEVPFLEGITPPPNATPVLPQTVNDGKPLPQGDSNTVILLISILITLLLGAGIGIFWYLKKKKEPDSSF